MEFGALGITLGMAHISYYGLCITIGIAVAAGLGWYQTRRFHQDFNDFILIAAGCALPAILGAKGLYLIVMRNEIDWRKLSDMHYLNSLMQGGFVFYGGLLGGLAGLSFFHCCTRIDVASYAKTCI